MAVAHCSMMVITQRRAGWHCSGYESSTRMDMKIRATLEPAPARLAA